MNKFVSLLPLLLSWACLSGLGAQNASTLPIIPKIDAVSVDGDLDEWRNIPAIRTGNSELLSRMPLQWKGVADASFNLNYGWNETGLYVAVRVFDDSLRNDDLLQIFLTSDLQQWQPLRNTVKIDIAPPTAERDVSFKFVSKVQDEKQGQQVKVASKMEAGGYTLEAFVPLELLPGFASVKESTVSALLSFTDNDRGRIYAQKMSRSLEDSTPGRLIQFALGESPPAVAGLNEFKLYTNVIRPDPVLDSQLQFTVEVAPQLLTSETALKVEVLDGEKIIASQTVPRASFQAADGLLRAALEFDLTKLPDAGYQLAFTLQSSAAGEAPRIVKSFDLFVQSKKLVGQTIDKLAEVNLPALVEKEPFRASAYFGLVGAVEWLKWGLEQKETYAIREATEEIPYRFAALEGGAFPSADSMYSLLELTRNPEAQMVVEFKRERKALYPQEASLSIYWGGMPLVSGLADTYQTDKEVADRLGKDTDAVSRPSFTIGETTIYDLPQTLREPLELAQYQPDAQILLPSCRRRFKRGILAGTKGDDWLEAESA